MMMVSSEFVWNHMQPDGSFVSHWESLKSFEPDQEAFRHLLTEIEFILGRKTPDDFNQTLFKLMTSIRSHVFNHVKSVRCTDKAEDLDKLLKALKGLNDLINTDNGVHEITKIDIWLHLQSKYPELDQDLISDTANNAEILIDTCAELREQVKGQAKSFNTNEMKLVFAEELARLLSGLGVKLTKYRAGAYHDCLRLSSDLLSFKQRGEKYDLEFAKDLLPLMKRAISSYADKPRFYELDIR
jgi:hypothetical protein